MYGTGTGTRRGWGRDGDGDGDRTALDGTALDGDGTGAGRRLGPRGVACEKRRHRNGWTSAAVIVVVAHSPVTLRP